MADRSRGRAPLPQMPPSREEEIEAVLASIRQLTAEAAGLLTPNLPDPPGAPADPAPDPPAASPGALVLTPAQRLREGRERDDGERDDEERDEGESGAGAPAAEGEAGPEDDLLPGAAAEPLEPGSEEARLRLLVARLVEEEVRAQLRGPLGHALTASVRKLARQEVQRALAEGERP